MRPPHSGFVQVGFSPAIGQSLPGRFSVPNRPTTNRMRIVALRWLRFLASAGHTEAIFAGRNRLLVRAVLEITSLQRCSRGDRQAKRTCISLRPPSAIRHLTSAGGESTEGGRL